MQLSYNQMNEIEASGLSELLKICIKTGRLRAGKIYLE